MINIQNENTCCGCTLCEKICPVNAIYMESGSMGFLYPRVNSDLCVGCGVCDKNCPFLRVRNYVVDSSHQSFYIARSSNMDTLMNSSSGGMFTEISDYFLEHGGVVYAAAFDHNFCVVHKRADNIVSRNQMRGSKYVQSSISDVFDFISKDIQEGVEVCFFGTPCQCSALKHYIENKRLDIEKCFLVDLVCHGVSSPIVWKDYLKFIKKRYDIKDIENINFRNKRYGYGYNMTIQGANGSYYKPGVEDPFISIFSKNLARRPSCFNCKFKTLVRETDITIGDFQKAEKYYPDFCDGLGHSLLITNTSKGALIFDAIKNNITYLVSDSKKAEQVNLHSQISIPRQDEMFKRDYKVYSFDKVLAKYTEYGLINRVYGKSRRFARKLVDIGLGIVGSGRN